MMVKYGATSLVAAAALRLLVESYAATANDGRIVGLPLSPLVEMRGLTAAPVEFAGGHRWRVSDDPMRHVFRMAAWNALGWPIHPALDRQWRPALFPLPEEDARADGVTRGDLQDYSGKPSYLPADAHGATRGRFIPHLERVEEEAAHLFEAENATSFAKMPEFVAFRTFQTATKLQSRHAPWTDKGNFANRAVSIGSPNLAAAALGSRLK